MVLPPDRLIQAAVPYLNKTLSLIEIRFDSLIVNVVESIKKTTLEVFPVIYCTKKVRNPGLFAVLIENDVIQFQCTLPIDMLENKNVEM